MMFLPGKKTRGKQKIERQHIRDKNKRYTTFYKRKEGLLKKAVELAKLTSAEVLVLVASETRHVYSYATPTFRPIADSQWGYSLTEDCLDSETPASDEMPTAPQHPQPPLITQPGPALHPSHPPVPMQSYPDTNHWTRPRRVRMGETRPSCLTRWRVKRVWSLSLLFNVHLCWLCE